MTDLSAIFACISARPGALSLRQRICQALADVLDQNSAADLGNKLGHAPSTISRREATLKSWPADELLLLAVDDNALARSIRTYLTGELEREGQAIAITSDLSADIGNSAKVNIKIAEAIADNKISVAEARGIISALQERRRHEDERLIPDLVAVTRNIA